MCSMSLVTAYRLPEPVEQVGAWLFSVARNRIIDRFRKKREEPLPDGTGSADDEHWLEAVLPSPENGPEAAYARTVLLEELYAALEELPQDQRTYLSPMNWMAQFQGDGGGKRSNGEHASGTQTVCGAASAGTSANDL